MRSEADPPLPHLAHFAPCQTIPSFELVTLVANEAGRQINRRGEATLLQHRQRHGEIVAVAVIERDRHRWYAVGPVAVIFQPTHLFSESGRGSADLVVGGPLRFGIVGNAVVHQNRQTVGRRRAAQSAPRRRQPEGQETVRSHNESTSAR